MLILSDKDQLCLWDDGAREYKNLYEFLSKMYTLLCGIPDAVSKIYFKHTQTQKQLFSVDDSIEPA